MTTFIYIALAIIIGGFIPIQGSINTKLASYFNHPLRASFISFLVGTLTLIIINLFVKESLPSFERIFRMPFHIFIGGILGAFFVTSMIFLIPKIGTAALLGASVAGQMLVSIVIDHRGLLEVPVHPASILRLAGVLLLFSGVYLIQRF